MLDFTLFACATDKMSVMTTYSAGWNTGQAGEECHVKGCVVKSLAGCQSGKIQTTKSDQCKTQDKRKRQEEEWEKRGKMNKKNGEKKK